MNKLLFVARKAKGLTEKQLAEALKIEEVEYLTYECNLEKLPVEIVEKLKNIFDIPAAYFLLYDAFDNKEQLDILKQYKESLSSLTKLEVPTKAYIDVAKLGIESLMLHDELKVSYLKQLELENENLALRELYIRLKQTIEKTP